MQRGMDKVLRGAGWVLGLGFIGACVAFAWDDEIGKTLAGVAPIMGLALLAIGAGNLLLTGLLWWAVTAGLDQAPRVKVGTMLGLTAASGLANYAPLPKAGLLARAGYLKIWHRVPVKQSAASVLAVLALAALVLGGACLAMLARSTQGEAMAWGMALVWVAVLSLACPVVAKALMRGKARWAWAWPALRAADLAVSSARLAVAMAALGAPIDGGTAVLLASGSLTVKLLGITPNGLGISEWVVTALAGVLMPIEASVAAAGALLDRAAELGVLVLFGAPSSAVLMHAQRKSAAVNGMRGSE